MPRTESVILPLGCITGPIAALELVPVTVGSHTCTAELSCSGEGMASLGSFSNWLQQESVARVVFITTSILQGKKNS